MGRIHVLDQHTAELIAAGEVVERPASVVKELMENAMDAGATAVTVEIENGGATLIRVTDNGSGIEREDVPLAFLRHATSKVRCADDLESIVTLGFRGEALASIAEVSRVELRTCRREDEAGTRYIIEGGVEQSCEDDGCAVGTTILVQDLFFNVPARMKFLKKDVAEGNAVSGVVSRLAMSHPDVAVRLIREGREVLMTAGNGVLTDCLYTVLGKEFAATQTPVDYVLGGVHVYGTVCRPDSGRPSRTLQQVFLNGRYVRSQTVSAALDRAYHGLMMTGRFPTCVLFVDIPPETVDVNVHPTKMEVRFVNERPIFDAVYHGVRAAIEQNHARKQAVLGSRPTPEQIRLSLAALAAYSEEQSSSRILTLEDSASPKSPLPSTPMTQAAPAADRSRPLADDRPRPVAAPAAPAAPVAVVVPPVQTASKPGSACPSPLTQTETTAVSQPPALPLDPPASPAEERPAVVVVGECFDTYVMAEMAGSLYLIDKHAAHERLLYEQLRSTAHVDSQQLLTPASVALSSEEMGALLEAQTELAAAGFEIEEFGSSEVLVRAVPLLLAADDPAQTLRAVAGELASGRREVTTDKLDWLYHNTACRAAVKGGMVSTPAERQALAERVLWDPSIRTCPHGRPVCIELTRRELEKQFGRIV